MTLKKISWFSLALSLLLILPSSALAQAQGRTFAESGNWWDVARPGEGLVLERQGNLVGMILFTYTASGDPEFYLATGEITPRPHLTAPPIEGLVRNEIKGTLYRFKNGPVFNSSRSYFSGEPPANEAEPVGEMWAYILPFTSILFVRTSLDEDKVPEGAQQYASRNYNKSTFGYGGFGRQIFSSGPYQASRACWIDLRGRWVFVDNSGTTARDVWSFNFTELETSPAPQDMVCPEFADSDYFRANHVLTYRDPEAGATLRCVTRDIPPSSEEYQPEFWRCVLRTSDNESLLWFSVRDIGAKQIIGALGAPPESRLVWRGTPQVTGLRVD